MRALVLGSGAREHAIVHALRASPLVDGLYVAPGTPGMETEAEILDLSLIHI